MGIGKSMFALQRYLILAKSGNNNTSCTYVFEILHQNTETKTPISIPGEIPRADQRTKPELFVPKDCECIVICDDIFAQRKEN